MTEKPKKLRIAFLSTEFITEDDASGGLSNYLVRVGLGLLSYGHKPVVFVRSHINEETTYKGITVFRIHPEPDFFIKAIDKLTFKRLKRPLRNIAFSKTCRSLVMAEHEKEPFDIVQAASYAATALYAPEKIPVVVRLSSIESLWRKASGWPLTIAQWLIEYLEEKAIKKADGVFAPSRVIAEKANTLFNVPAAVIEPTYVPESFELDSSVLEQCDKADYLLYYGTISRLKGCGTIAEALPELFRKYPHIAFIFVGNSDPFSGDPIISRIRSNAGAKGNNIIFLDNIPHSRLYPLIHNARAIVLPSLIDNLPNTCIESMSMGKIVVGTRGASFEQLIEDGVSGFLAMPGNPSSLLDCIDRALTLPPSQKDELTLRVKKRIAMLSAEKTLPALLQYYEKVIDNRGNKNR